jgi:hypothetical protein
MSGYFAGLITQDIFSLGVVERLQEDGRWPTVQETYGALPDNGRYARFASGIPATPGNSSIDRLDYYNDTVTTTRQGYLPLSPTELRSYGGVMASSTSNGYFMGGAANNSSYIGRISYADETVTVLTTARSDTPVNNMGVAGNQYYGWTFHSDNVARIDYSNDDVLMSFRSSPSITGPYRRSCGNLSYAWSNGSNASTDGERVDRLDYSNDTQSPLPKGSLTYDSYRGGAHSNANYGWFGGGYDTPAGRTDVCRIDFSNDTATASPRGPLAKAGGYMSATGNPNYGYYGGGAVPGTFSSDIQRIDYANDTSTALFRSKLSSGRYGVAAGSAAEYGLPNVGANTPENWSPAIKNDYGYWVGTTTTSSAISRLEFANDTNSPTNRLFALDTTARLAGASSENYGYSGHGFPGNAKIARLDYMNDTKTMVFRSLLNAANPNKYWYSATSNTNYGWWAGGAPASQSDVNRTDWSNDTTLPLVRGNLSAARYAMGSAGNSNYGWFGGGMSPTTSRVDRIDYSNDGVTASVRGSISPGANRKQAAAGNANYGWWAGGQPAGSISIITRIDYSNDTPNSTPRGSLVAAGYALGAFSNDSYGWFSGGVSRQTRVDRVDFSNDNVTASPRGNLRIERYFHAGISATMNGLPQ